MPGKYFTVCTGLAVFDFSLYRSQLKGKIQLFNSRGIRHDNLNSAT